MNLQNKHTARRGFTMVELLTVVVILMILMGIGLVASQKISDSGKAQLTRATLGNCELILTESQVARGKTPSVFIDKDEPIRNQFTTAKGKTPLGNPIPPDSDELIIEEQADYIAHSIQRFVASTYATLDKTATQATDPITRIYGTLSDRIFVQGTTSIEEPEKHEGSVHVHEYFEEYEHYFLAILDGWGNRLIYKNDPNDLPLTNKANYTLDDFLPRRTTPYFASAGADGNFGNANLNPNVTDPLLKQLYDAAQDNMYSYEINE